MSPSYTSLEKFRNTGSLQGWVQGIRGNNHVQFLQLRVDGKILQVVCEKEKLGENRFRDCKSLTQETAILVTGTRQENPKATLSWELLLDEFTVLGNSENYPITPKEHGPDFLHNNRHLWLRSKRQLAILRIRSELSYAIREFFRERNYTLIDTPILTGSIGESAGTLFSTQYFDMGEAYLAQTGQLYLEAAIFAHSKVYCFGPTFRAEKSKTKRHLTEFWMVEAETAFLSQEENQSFQEIFLKSIVTKVIERSSEDLLGLGRDIESLKRYLSQTFPRVSYSEAISLLVELGQSIRWGEDINAEKESILTAHFGGPIFLTNFPKDIKAFYMKENPQDPRTVLSADLILPDGVGEVIGGSEREESYPKLTEKLAKEGLPISDYDWYLDLRKFGSVPHSGFGLGLERLLAWICGLEHVRECIPFPRMIYRLHP